MDLAWWQIVLGVIVGLLLLMILIIIHELGHAVAAVRNGVKVEEFGLGFPPRAKILGKIRIPAGKRFREAQDKSGKTLLTLNWLLPIGGFCQMKGETDDAREKGSYGAASFWAKTKILFAGVLMNLVAAMVIFTILAWVGLPKIFPDQFALASDNSGSRGTAEIAGVVKGSPAAAAGLKKGDVLTEVAGIKTEFSTQIPNITADHAGQKITIEYQRDGETRTTTATLNKSSSSQGYLGIQTVQKDAPTIRATWSAPLVGVVNTFQFIGATFSGLGGMLGNLFGGLWGLVTGGGAAAQQQLDKAGESVGGPVMILAVIVPNALAAGPVTLLWIMGVISLTLTVMNILPIPGLDGGRWYLAAGFKLFKKKLTHEKEGTINGIGMLILYGLIVLITVHDIWGMF